jgi:NAD(P)-dependent dehydrogenase (short-subunit alcohol dehydrogenase family)
LEFGDANVEFMRVDVSSATNLERSFEKCLQVFGTLDIVVNNAGVDGEINWETQMKINFFVSRVFLLQTSKASPSK